MAYKVQLEKFEGPLDLLLFLIKKNEVDLFDIPVSEITQSYLEYIEVIQLLDLEGASDYIYMAATLIRIKAKMLLPKPPVEVDEEEEDPRDELVRRLLEYQRFKEVAMQMVDYETSRKQLFVRRYFDFDSDSNGQDEDRLLAPDNSISLFDLISIFKDLLHRAPKVTEHSIESIPVTIEEQINYIIRELDAHDGEVLFYEMIEKVASRIAMIVTFLALLELLRQGEIETTQSSMFGEIWIRRKRWIALN